MAYQHEQKDGIEKTRLRISTLSSLVAMSHDDEAARSTVSMSSFAQSNTTLPYQQFLSSQPNHGSAHAKKTVCVLAHSEINGETEA